MKLQSKTNEHMDKKERDVKLREVSFHHRREARNGDTGNGKETENKRATEKGRNTVEKSGIKMKKRDG